MQWLVRWPHFGACSSVSLRCLLNSSSVSIWNLERHTDAQFRSAYFLMLYMWMGSQLALRSRSCMASGTIGSTGFSSRIHWQPLQLMAQLVESLASFQSSLCPSPCRLCPDLSRHPMLVGLNCGKHCPCYSSNQMKPASASQTCFDECRYGRHAAAGKPADKQPGCADVWG